MSAVMNNGNEPMPEVVPPLGGESILPPWVRPSTGGFTAKLLKAPRGVLQPQTEGRQLLSLPWGRERGDHTPLCRGEAPAEGWALW